MWSLVGCGEVGWRVLVAAAAATVRGGGGCEGKASWPRKEPRLPQRRGGGAHVRVLVREAPGRFAILDNDQSFTRV